MAFCKLGRRSKNIPRNTVLFFKLCTPFCVLCPVSLSRIFFITLNSAAGKELLIASQLHKHSVWHSRFNGRTSRRGVHKSDGNIELFRKLFGKIISCRTHIQNVISQGVFPLAALKIVIFLVFSEAAHNGHTKFSYKPAAFGNFGV